MTEAYRLASTDPEPMLECIRGYASDRKLRLFACSWCRRVWQHLDHADSRIAVEVMERHAEGFAGGEELARARYAAQEAMFGPGRTIAWKAVWVATDSDAWDAAKDVSQWTEWDWLGEDAADELLREQAGVLRCVVGNPFRAVRIETDALTPTVMRLATSAYEWRALPLGSLDAELLAVLSDALEEGGSVDGSILEHLREPGRHVRGCWVVDLLLGKS